MREKYLLVRGRILQEIGNLDRVVERVQKGMEKARSSFTDSDLFLDAVALNLHDFYSGLERVFQFIAAHVDQNVPSGKDWHRELLQQMHLEIPDVRPAVLSTETYEALDELLRFRHVVRNVYTFDFDAERMERLVRDLQPSFERVQYDLQGFADFLSKIAD